MEKKPLVEKMAEKAFESEAFQKSWQMHERAFGPILLPAFTDSMAARVHLTNALNHISRRETGRGIELLEKIEPACQNDADHAAWNFFMGLAYEMAGDLEGMGKWYAFAIDYRPPFYLPYLKLAKYQHQKGALDASEKNFEKAIMCLQNAEKTEQNTVILASTYANFAATLVHLKDYARAKEMLLLSESLIPVLAGRDGTWAILYACLGDRENAEKYLHLVKERTPLLWSAIQKVVEEKLAHKE